MRPKGSLFMGAAFYVPKPWSLLFDKCLKCGRKDRPHHSHGKCQACYSADRYQGKERERRRVAALARYHRGKA